MGNSFYIIRQFPHMLTLFVPPFISVVYKYMITPDENLLESFRNVFGYMISVLSFLLATQLQAALKSNALGVQRFNNVCRTLIMTSVEFCSMQDTAWDEHTMHNIRGILSCFPGLIKWHFRKSVNVDLLFTSMEVVNGKKVYHYLKDTTPEVYCELKQYTPDLGEFASVMYILGNQIEKLNNGKSSSTSAWHKIYTIWGSINDIFNNEDPDMVKWFMNVCMLTFIFLLPIQFIELGLFWSMISSFLVSYFFLGLWIASRKVGNPFLENVGAVFPTVTDDAIKTVKSINAIFKNRRDKPLDSICNF